MNVKRIVVDELPEVCWNCKLYVWIDAFSFCGGMKKAVPPDEVNYERPDWCPLVVEECCEWVLEEYEMCISPHNNGNWCDKDEYQFCPTCGKHIKYVEVE
jgi:hypothetical protein